MIEKVLIEGIEFPLNPETDALNGSSFLLVFVMALSVVACNKSTDEEKAIDETQEAEQVEDSDEENEDIEKAVEDVSPEIQKREGVTWKFKEEEYKIANYWPAPDTYFDSYVMKGIEAFNQDFGQDVKWMVGTDWTQDIENQSVEALAAQGYNLFSIFGVDTTGANALFSELYDNDCEVVAYAGLVDDPQESALTFASDVYQMGYDSTKLMIEKMGGKGKIICVLENLNDVNTQARQKGVEDAVAENPDVEIVQTVADIATVDEGFQKISDAIAANADVDGIVATAGTISISLANAMSDYYGSNPDAKHIYAATVDQSQEVMDAIAEGHIDYTLAQNGFGQGYISALALMYLKDGWEPVEWGQHVDSGSLVIDKSNMDTWEADIEALTWQIVASLETEILKKPE